MNTCKTCKWWIPPGLLHALDIGASETMGVCRLTVVMVAEPFHPESLALAADQDGWKAALNTSPDFGCVQWVEELT